MKDEIRNFGHELLEKFAISLTKRRGGGSNAILIFFEMSSIFAGTGFPNVLQCVSF